MGCDIHMYVETYEGDRWRFREELDLGRCYSVFSILAGVRGGEEPIVDARGLPEDRSDHSRATQALHYADHSFSWVTAQEIWHYRWKDLQEEQATLYGWLQPWMNYYPREHVRFVFGFDS